MQKKPREISDFNTAFLYYPARSDSLSLLRKKIFITISHHLCLILKILFMLIDQCRKDDPGKPADDSCQDHKPADDQCRDLFHCPNLQKMYQHRNKEYHSHHKQHCCDKGEELQRLVILEHFHNSLQDLKSICISIQLDSLPSGLSRYSMTTFSTCMFLSMAWIVISVSISKFLESTGNVFTKR